MAVAFVFLPSWLKRLSVLVSATVLVQLINFALLPVLLRLFGPEAYGEYGAFQALLLVLLPLSALGLPQALVQAKGRLQKYSLVQLSLFISVALALLVFVVSLLFAGPIAQVLSLSNLTLWLYAIPVAMLGSTLLQLRQQQLIGLQQVRTLARAEVVQNLLVQLSRLGGGGMHSGASVLVAIALLAPWAHCCFLTQSAPRAPRAIVRYGRLLKLGATKRRKRLLRVMRQFQAFIWFQTPQQLLNTAAQSAPVLLLAGYFGPSAAGFYTLAKTVLALPALVLGKAVGDVFYPHFVHCAEQRQPLVLVLLKAMAGLALLGLLPFALLAFYGHEIFGWVFGDQWQSSGDYARWMALWLYVAFVNTPCVKAVMVLRIQHWATLLNLFTFIGRVLAFVWVASDNGQPVSAIAAFALVGLLHVLLFSSMTLYFCGKKESAVAGKV